MVKVTLELHQTLIEHPNVSVVHFDAQGRHYFNVFDLQAKKGDDKTALYGRGQFGYKQLLPGITNVDKLTEDISVGIPDTLITESVSREDVLAVVIKQESKLIADIASASPDEIAKLRALLLVTEPEAAEETKGKKTK